MSAAMQQLTLGSRCSCGSQAARKTAGADMQDMEMHYKLLMMACWGCSKASGQANTCTGVADVADRANHNFS